MGDQNVNNVVSMNQRGDRFDAAEELWDDEDDFPGEEAFRYDHDLGLLTIQVYAGGDLVDTIHRPVQGSGYECAVLELRHPKPRPPAPRPRHERELAWLARLVGGTQALDGLGIDPLPDEPLDATRVRQDLQARVMAIGDRCDQVADELHDPELRTACRRLLVRAVAAEPALLLRSDRDDTAAGAVVLAVAKGNDLVGAGRAIPTTVLTDLSGLRSSPTERARSFAHALAGPEGTGFARHDVNHDGSRGEPDVLVLGSPDLLLGRFRAQLVRLRGLAHEERHRGVG
jgi:hypothetical protein